MTSNLSGRLSQHSAGLSRITKNRGKIDLVFKQEFDDKNQAAKREKEIKGWTRAKKDKLIRETACSEE